MEIASIRATKASDSVISGTTWQFELVDGAGQMLLRSSSFPGSARGPKRNREADAEMDHFYALLKRQGWQILRPPQEEAKWWAFDLARNDGAIAYMAPQQPATFSQPPQVRRGGMGCGVWSMWGLTMAIVIGLFLVCVLLAFTTEIRVTPGT